MNRSYEDPRVAQQRELHARRYGVPGHAPGTPGWAGAGGIAQSPGPGCRSGGGGGAAPPHAYGSLGYASMGDGSMDMATGGERMDRRYGLTWKYENTCPLCGDEHENDYDERRYGGSCPPGEIRTCDIMDPFTKKCTVWGCKKAPIAPETIDPFGASRGLQLSAGGGRRSGRRKKRSKRAGRRKHRQVRRYGEGEGVEIGHGPSGLVPSGKMKRLLRSKRKSEGSFAGP